MILQYPFAVKLVKFITYAGSLPHTDLTIPKMQYKCRIVLQHFYPYHAHEAEVLCVPANSNVIS